MKKACLLAVVGAVLVSAAGARGADDEVLVCPRVTDAPLIDGTLGESVWRQAIRLENFHLLGADAPARRQTRVLLACGKEALFIGFECLEPNVARLRARKREHDDAVWSDDCVEVMLDPEPWEPGTYYHLLANVFGSRHDANAQGKAWNPEGGWQAAGHTGADRWTVEIAVPFKALGVEAPACGHVWRMNFMRENYASSPHTAEYSTWGRNPTKHLDNVMAMRFVAFESRDLIANGDFETGAPGRDTIAGWSVNSAKGAEGEAGLRAEGGNRFVRIRKTNRAGSISVGQALRLQPHTSYRVRMRVRHAIDGSAWLMASGVSPQVHHAVRGTAQDWTVREFVFNPGERKTTTILGSVGYGRATGVLEFDDVEVVANPARVDPNLRCLTGNSPTGQGNLRVAGTYRYFEPGLTVPFVPASGDKAKKTEPIPFSEGVLTDNAATAASLVAGKVSISGKTGMQGIDIQFDLGKEYFVRQVEVLSSAAEIRNVLVSVRPEGAKRFVLVGCSTDRLVVSAAAERFPYVRLADLDSAAREVRVRVQSGTRDVSVAEVQIWGEPIDGHDPGKTKALALQAGAERPPVSERSVPIVQGRGACVVSPQPREVAELASGFALSAGTGIRVADARARTRRTAELLAEDIRKATGLDLPVAAAGAARPAGGSIVLGCAPLLDGASTELVRRKPLRVSPSDPGEQGYGMRIDEEGVCIVGSDDAGVFYGTQTLMQLIEQLGGNPVRLPGLQIRDWPHVKLRQAYTFVTDERSGDFYKKLIPALARHKINAVLSSGVVKDGHAAKLGARGGCTKARALEVVAYCRDRFVDVVPSVDITGKWMFWSHHDYIEKKPGEKRHPGGHGCAIDPTLPEAEQLVYAALRDAVEVFQPRVIDCGVDEINQNGRWCMSERNKGVDPHAAFTNLIMRNYRLCKELGTDMMLYSTHFTREKVEKMSPPYHTFWKFRDELPKDIVISVWTGRDAFDYFVKKGHRVRVLSGYSTFGSPGELTSHRDRVWAHLITNWGQRSDNEDTYYATGYGATFYPDIAYWAEEMWSPDHPVPLAATAPKAFTSDFSGRLRRALLNFEACKEGYYRLPSLNGATRFFQLDLARFANRALRDDVPGDGAGWLDLGPSYDCRRLPQGLQELGGVPFAIAPNCVMLEGAGTAGRTLPGQTAGIPVGRRAASLVFLHALSTIPDLISWNYRPLCAGAYRINYADGTSAESRLVWKKNIMEWDHNREGLSRPAYVPQARPVWLGNTRSGADITLYAYEWVNPHPARPIATLDFLTQEPDVIMKPILFAVTGVAIDD